MAFGGRRRGSIGVCLFIVVVRKVVECLQGRRRVGMEGNAVLAGAVEVLEDMESGFVVLDVRVPKVRCQEGD